MSQEPKINHEIPLDWIIPPGLQTRFVNNIIVQNYEGEHIISFFEIQPPILIGDPETVTKKVEGITSIPAICVARVAMTHERLKSLIDALQSNYDRAETKKEEE